MNDHVNQPIDAVVTWVDGDDLAHQEKLNEYLRTLGHRPKTASRTRFREVGEFEFCIASLIKYAPWLRHIYILTDQQTPPFWEALQQSDWADRVILVDHTSVFAGFEDCLPTFNIRSLISVLWRIPDLSEQFIFLNDDFVLLRPVQPEDFFSDGKLVIRGRWALQTRAIWGALKSRLVKSPANGLPALARPGNRAAQARSAAMAGFSWRYWRVTHSPHPMLRSVLANYFARHPDKLAENIAYPLRSDQQFLADALCLHLAYIENKTICSNRLKTIRLKPDQYSNMGLFARLAWAKASRTTAFGCVQSLDRAGPRNRQQIFDWLEHSIGRLADNMVEGAEESPSNNRA